MLEKKQTSVLFTDRYRIAAFAYLTYAIIYFFGALYRLSPERQAQVFGMPWWVYFVLGALVGIVFPWLVWNRYKWFTRILMFGPLAKGCVLLSREYKSYSTGEELDCFYLLFAVLAFAASFALGRAGWGKQ